MDVRVKVSVIEDDLKPLKVAVRDRNKAVDGRINKIQDKVESCDFAVGLVNDKVVTLEKENESLKENLTYLQSQSMRNNLIFTNIPEEEAETNERSENKLREFIKDNLKAAQDIVDGIKFERVHRMGQKSANYPRKIVAKFHEFKEKELVRMQCKCLQGSVYRISEQFPKEIVDKRRKLFAEAEKERESGKTAWVLYDTLCVNGKPVRD